MHKITKRDIQTGIVMAWHKLTNIVAEITRDNSGISYGMEMRPLYYMAGQMLNLAGNPEIVYVPSGAKQLVALDDGLPIGGAVNGTYTMISNAQMLDTIEASLEGTPHKIVSAGSVENRTKVFVSIALDSNSFTAAGRTTESVLNFLWGHGGKLSVRAKTGMTTVVCANTLAVALGEKGEFALNIKHTKGSIGRLGGMIEAVRRHLGAQERYIVTSDRLANEPCTATDAREIFAGLLSRPAKLSEFVAEPMQTRRANQVDALVQLFSHGAGNDGANFADLLNAWTDYYSHQNSGGEDTWKQYVSSEFGSGASAKEEFYRLLGGTVSDKASEITEARAELATVVNIGRAVLAAH